MPNEQEALVTETIQRPHCGPAIDPVGPCIRRNYEKVTPLTHTDPNPRGKGPNMPPTICPRDALTCDFSDFID